MEFIVDENSSLLKEDPEYFDFVLVRPEDFLIQTTSPDMFINNRLQGPLHKEESLKNLMGRLRAGLPISPPYIDVNITKPPGKITQHEGRHRCIAAIECGVKLIPILIFYTKWIERPGTLTGMDFIHMKVEDVPSQMRGNLTGFRHQWA